MVTAKTPDTYTMLHLPLGETHVIVVEAGICQLCEWVYRVPQYKKPTVECRSRSECSFANFTY